MGLRVKSSRNKIGITVTLLSVLAFLLYQFNIFTLGFSLIPLFVALILFAWAVGKVVTTCSCSRVSEVCC